MTYENMALNPFQAVVALADKTVGAGRGPVCRFEGIDPPPERYRLEQEAGRMYSEIKILVVDDHEDIRHMLRRFLELELDERAEIVDVATSSDGLARFAECSADIVLVDYMMPDMTGVEFARVLREKHRYTGKLFVYSSAGSLIPFAEATALGVEVIEKTSVLELIEKIREAARI